MELTSALLYVILALGSVALYLLRRNLNYWKNRNIPHDIPHALMGNMKGLRSSVSLAIMYSDYYKKFKGTGPFAGFYLGQRPIALVLEKDTIKNILIKDFTNFTDRGMYYNEKSDPLTGHLFFVDGQKWRNLRTRLSPIFTSGKIKIMYSTLVQVADQLREVLKEKSQQNRIMDVRDLCARFTIDIIGSVAFGIECNTLKNPDAEFLKYGRRSIENLRHNSFIMNFIDSFPKFARKLGMRILPEDVHQFFMNSITETIKYRQQHKNHRNDFIDLLIEINKSANENSEWKGLTIEEMAAQVFVFFLGGFETSSSTMAYALYELAQNQDIQDRLREEVTEMFASNKDSVVPYDTIMNATYLDQVIAETLRKYPIVPHLNRQALNDYVVPGNPKYVIEKGTAIIIPVYGIQHDPEFYPNPEEFDPERFAPEIAKQRDAMEYMPFGDGPRNCIGMRFGKMQTRLGLATVIHRFRFSVCPKTEIPITFNPRPVVITPTNPIYLNVEAI